MKRKITTDLSKFNYKRHCPIFKEDFNKITTDSEASSEEELLISPFKKHKPDANCTKSSEKNGEKNTALLGEMYSSKFVLESSSDDDIETCQLDKTNGINTIEKSSCSLKERTSLEQDDINYRLGVLKGIFKNAYTDQKLLNAISDTNGLDHAVSVLMESMSDNEEGLDVCSAPQTSNQIANEDLSSSDDDSVEQDLEILMKKFPAYGKDELRNVLETNSFCLEDAMGSLELFSSPEKKVGTKQKKKKCISFDKVVDCVTIDDNSDIENNFDVNKNTSAELKAPLKSDLTNVITVVNDNCDNDEDDNYGSSEGEQDLAMSSADKASVVSFCDTADPIELALVKGCSVNKAKMICSLRPFGTWKDLLKKVQNTKSLSEEFLWECQTFVKEKNKMEYLMKDCEHISKTMKDFVEVKSSTTNVSENASMLVTKEQYVTEEPSLVSSGMKLKSYQLTGLNWIIALHKRGLNGILADEMGLGKTIQSIVFLAYLIEQKENGPHLIVVPSSTFDNWKRELKQWCPSIKCLHYSGSQAERSLLRDEALDSRHDLHVLLTTYSVAISTVPDRIFLKKMEFHFAIYDEAHMLKNMKAQRYQQLLRIKPRRMLMLTGTPIQNNLLELMSLLSFVMPDMFVGRIEGIKLLFGDSKLKQNRESAYQKEKVLQAKRIMEPFVLRRVKAEVLGNSLPEKHEHCIECDVPTRQRKVYDETFASCSRRIHSGELSLKGAGVLIELRKAANHSLLLRNYYTDDMLSEMARKYCKDPSHRDSEVNLVFEDMQVMSDFELRGLCLEERCLKDFHLPHELIMDSAKFLYLDSVLPKMKQRGDRILLFNQFVMMMDILEVYLQTRGYTYLRFDGSVSVSERQSLIDRFNTEDDIFMFIISTRAGGMGINLTAANVVILYDSDYNPHNDKQAECRCHRLGQTREVNVYRLICKGTCEEKIWKCANDKIRLHEDISGNGIYKEDDIIQSLVSSVFGSSSTKLEEK